MGPAHRKPSQRQTNQEMGTPLCDIGIGRSNREMWKTLKILEMYQINVDISKLGITITGTSSPRK